MTGPDADQRLSALLESVAPEPPSTLTVEDLRRAAAVPAATRRGWRALRPAASGWLRPALVTAAVLVVVLTTFLVVRPASAPVPVNRATASSTATGEGAECERFDARATPVRLGADGATTFGNPTPVSVPAATGSLLRVVSRFGARVMTFPVAMSPGLEVLCTRHDAAGYQTYFRVLVSSGSVLVTSRTADCLPCIQMTFATRVVVVSPGD
jgi:hypothetical protein